jgi:hypothetical protein
MKRHKWKAAPTKTNPHRDKCEREDCGLYRIGYRSGGWWKYSYMRGRRHTLYGVLGDKTPPCGPPDAHEQAWMNER